MFKLTDGGAGDVAASVTAARRDAALVLDALFTGNDSMYPSLPNAGLSEDEALALALEASLASEGQSVSAPEVWPALPGEPSSVEVTQWVTPGPAPSEEQQLPQNAQYSLTYSLEALRFARQHGAFIRSIENSIQWLLASTDKIDVDSPPLLLRPRNIVQELAAVHQLYSGTIDLSPPHKTLRKVRFSKVPLSSLFCEVSCICRGPG